MKRVFFSIFFSLSMMAGLSAQEGFYYCTATLQTKDLNVGRGKVYSNIFGVKTISDRDVMLEEFGNYLASQVPKTTYEKYFKSKPYTWSQVTTSKMEIFGPFKYSEAFNQLRKDMKAHRSRDWLTLEIAGFGFLEK